MAAGVLAGQGRAGNASRLERERRGLQRDLAEIIAIVSAEAADLFGTVPSHAEHTILREALIVADHNAYHIGELGILRQVANGWGRNHTA